MSLTLIEGLLLTFIIVTAVLSAVLRDVLAVIIVFGGYSLGMAMLWVALQAPDVGLTEAAVGAGVMTVLFLVTIAKTVRITDITADLDDVRWSALFVVLLLVGTLVLTLPALPAVGDPASPPFQHVSPYYLENAYDETGITNVVTAILVAYRGLDTFGEATVVFAAGVAVLTVLRHEVMG